MKITPARIIALLLCVGLVGLGWFVSGRKRARFVPGAGQTIELRVSSDMAHIIAAEWAHDPPVFSSTLVDSEYPEAKTELAAVADGELLRVEIPTLALERFDLFRFRWVSKPPPSPKSTTWTPDAGSIIPHVKEWWRDGQRERAIKFSGDLRIRFRAIESRGLIWSRSGRTIWLEVESHFDPPGTFKERARNLDRLVDRLNELAQHLTPPPRPRLTPRSVSFQREDLERWISDPQSLIAAKTSPTTPRTVTRSLAEDWGTPQEREAIDLALEDLTPSFHPRVAFELDPAPLTITLTTLATIRRLVSEIGTIQSLVSGTRIRGPGRLVITNDPLRPTGWTATKEDPKRLKYITELVIHYTTDADEIRRWLIAPERERRGFDR